MQGAAIPQVQPTSNHGETRSVPCFGRVGTPLQLLLAVACVGSLFPAHAQGWRSLPALLEPRQEIGGALLGNQIVVLGGLGSDRQPLSSVEAYRHGDDAWHELPALPIAVHHPAAAAVGGLLVVIGGYPADAPAGATDAVQLYDPATEAWRLGTPMPAPLGASAAVALNGRILTFGGANRGTSVTDVRSYDPVHDTWSELPPMPTARDHLGAALVEGLIHVVGGRNQASFTLGVHEVFDPATGTWATLDPMPTGRSGHGLVAIGGCLIALGGEGNEARADGLFPEVERFDPVAGAWSSLAPMPVPRHGMVALADGERIVVAGGGNVAGYGASAVVDAFVPPPCG